MNNEYLNLQAQMTQHGLGNPGAMYLDGQLHRYASDGRYDKSEWYIGFESEDYIYCTYGSWRTSSDVSKYTYCSSFSQLSQQEKEKIQADITEKQRIYFEERQKQIKLAKENLNILLQKVTKVNQNDYVDKKKINPKEIFELDGKLLIKAYDIDDNVASVQMIDSDGNKLFAKGLPMAGLFHPLGDFSNPKVIHIAEGYATAHSIFEATEEPTICAFSLQNLFRASAVMKLKYPGASLRLYADVASESLKMIKEWEKEFAGEGYIPPCNVKGYDFNDYHVEHGLDKLKDLIKPTPKLKGSNLVEHCLNPLRKPTEFYIDGLLPVGCTTIIYADGGVGKSFLSYELALAVSTGTPWMHFNTKKARICYFDSEMSDDYIAERCTDAMTRRNAAPQTGFFSLHTYVSTLQELGEPLNLYNPAHRKQIELIANDHDVIFFDNLQNLCVEDGLENYENSSKHWQKVAFWLRSLHTKKKSFVIIHHAGKDGTIRGTSRLKGDAGTIIRLESFTPPKELEDALSFTMSFDKTRHIHGKYSRPSKRYLFPRYNIDDLKLSGGVNDRFIWQLQNYDGWAADNSEK